MTEFRSSLSGLVDFVANAIYTTKGLYLSPAAAETAARAAIDAIGHAQTPGQPASLYDLAEAIHDARFGPDYPPHLVNPFKTESLSGQDYCFRLARAVMTKFKVTEVSISSTDRTSK